MDVGTYVKRAKAAVAQQIDLPPGYSMVWSGQYEYMIRAEKRLMIVVPMTLVIIFVLLYLNFQNITESLIVMLSVPENRVLLIRQANVSRRLGRGGHGRQLPTNRTAGN